MYNPLNLTFGVEIECIIYFDPAVYEEGLSHAEGILWKKNVSASMHRESKLGVLLRYYIATLLNRKGFSTYEITSEGGNQKWTVCNDVSIDIKDGPHEGHGFLECDVEIKSPAMRFCPKALRRVQKVVRLITKHFDATVNASCGLHVHVGNQKNGFPLPTLKKFCMLTAMFESQLNSFHPAHRIGNHHAKGPSAAFQGRSPWDTVRRIQLCETKEELVRLFADNERVPDRCFAYNLLPMVVGPHKTIEFRQHEGTLDWPQIVNWVQVVGGMVIAMHNISVDGLAQLISSCAFDPRFTAVDLLIKLRLENLVDYYKSRLMFPDVIIRLTGEISWKDGTDSKNSKSLGDFRSLINGASLSGVRNVEDKTRLSTHEERHQESRIRRTPWRLSQSYST